MDGLGGFIVWLFSLLIAYLIIWFAVKNGVKTAIKELYIAVETRDGHTMLSVKDREVPEEPEDRGILK